MLKIHDTLRFKFYTVITRDHVSPDYHEDDPERIILFKKPDGSLSTNNFGPWALRNAPADQASAFALLDEAQAPQAAVDLVSRKTDLADMECKMMQADITPLEFSPAEYEHLKVLGALNNLPHEICVRKRDLVACLPMPLTREFPEPEWPRPQTEDDNRPALATHTMLTIAPADFQELITMHDPQKQPGIFGTALLEKSHAYRCSFNNVAEEIGKSLLRNKENQARMVLLVSLYSYRDTVPPALPPEKKILSRQVLDALKKVEKPSESLGYLKGFLEKTP